MLVVKEELGESSSQLQAGSEVGHAFLHWEYHLSFLKHWKSESLQQWLCLHVPHLPAQGDGGGPGAGAGAAPCVVSALVVVAMGGIVVEALVDMEVVATSVVSATLVVPAASVVEPSVVLLVRIAQLQGVWYWGLSLLLMPGVQDDLHCA